MKKRICIVGGGNLGHYIAAKLGNKQLVNIYTRNAEAWCSEIEAEDITGISFFGAVQKASEKPQEVISDAEVIFITWPTNVLNERLAEIEPYINHDAWVCFCPGYGGKEFISMSLLKKGVHIFGTQRVFSSTKVEQYGKKVICIDNRPSIQVGAVKKVDLQPCCELIENLFEKKCIPYDNYLNITLTPSNPVLHTSRLYSLFKYYEPGIVYDYHFKFYSEWSEDSSNVLIKYDDEVQQICKQLSDMNLTGVKSLKEHYEIANVPDCNNDCERMTQKIKSLKFLKDFAPMVPQRDGFIPDFNSRYFQEDFIFGLCVIRAFAEILQTDTSQMDKILSWFKKLLGSEVLEKGHPALPQCHGILTKEEIYDFYLK